MLFHSVAGFDQFFTFVLSLILLISVSLFWKSRTGHIPSINVKNPEGSFKYIVIWHWYNVLRPMNPYPLNLQFNI